MGAVCSSNKSTQSIQNRQNSVLENVHNSTGETSSILGGSVTRQRLDSVVSNCSSAMGFVSVLGIADLTDYEKRLIPKIWSECLKQNPYYCDHSFNRFVSKHPEGECILRRVMVSQDHNDSNAPYYSSTRIPARRMSSPTGNHLAPPTDSPIRSYANKLGDQEDVIQSEAVRLMTFFNRLIIDFDMDEERTQIECEELGRRHAQFLQHGLASIHWPAIAQCLVYEYKKTTTAMDESVEQNEMHMLAWTHFISAIIATIKDSFDQELSPNHSPVDGNFSSTECFKP